MTVLSKVRAQLKTPWPLGGLRLRLLAMGLGLTLLVLMHGAPLLEGAEVAAYDAEFHLRLRYLATPNDIVIVDVNPGRGGYRFRGLKLPRPSTFCIAPGSARSVSTFSMRRPRNTVGRTMRSWPKP